MLIVGTKVKVNGCEGKVQYSHYKDGVKKYHVVFDDKELIPPRMDVEMDNLTIIPVDKKEEPKSANCWHVWKIVGHSPVLDDPWYNCEKCSMRKEDKDK